MRIEELELKTESIKDEILTIDEQIKILKQKRCNLVKEREHVERERNDGRDVAGDDLAYPDNVINSSQQTGIN